MAAYSGGWTRAEHVRTLRAIAGDPRCSTVRRDWAFSKLRAMGEL